MLSTGHDVQNDLRTAARPRATKPPSPSLDAEDTDFQQRRDRLARIGRENPTARLAAFLVAIAYTNSGQGCGALTVSETTDAGFVADFLGLSFRQLRRDLLLFQAAKLIAPMSNGSLRITNLAKLELVADGHPISDMRKASETPFEDERVVVLPPRVYATETASLKSYDDAIRLDVIRLISLACLIVGGAVAIGIVGL